MTCGRLNVPDVQKKLLRYVRTNEISSIEKLVTRHNDLLSFEYGGLYDNHNILIIACNDQNSMYLVTAKTISKLIDLGADCTEPTRDDHWEAIHYAAINGNKEKLKAVLQRLTPEEANSLVYCTKHITKKYQFLSNKNVTKSYSNNALHILLKYGKRIDFRECCEHLIQKGVNVNQADSNGVTPLDLMKEEEELKDICARVDKFKEIFKVKPAFELVKFNKEEEFITKNLTKEEVNDVDGLNENLSSCTLLQMCCVKGLTACVKYILSKGGSPNKIIEKNESFPVLLAIKEDHEEVVNLLLQSPEILLPEDILIRVQTKYKHMKNFSRIDKYMELILTHLKEREGSKLKKYLLATDAVNRTALHYATHYRCSENILQLLSAGAPLTKKDLFGYTPLQSIEPSVLEQFFDTCIDVPKDVEGMDNMFYSLQNKKEKFSVEINYEALTAEEEESMTHESEFLYYLIKMKRLTYLMNHPVISSYLEVKWNKFRWAVFANLLLYLIAYASLLFYGFAFNSYPSIANNLLLTSLVLIFVRESLQLIIFRTDYLKRVDNLIDLLLIGGIIYIIASGWVNELINQNLQVAFSIVFLTSTLGIFLQLGNLPFFTIRVIMLRQITLSFLKYMMFYVFPLLAFFFCFYMLHKTDELTQDVFFHTLYDVAIMFAGGADSEYPENFQENLIFSHIIYIVFIVLIGIILQNLLIGLAVSDLQEIHKEAEFIDKKERANYMTNIERVLFSKHRDSSNGILKTFFRKLLKTGRIFGNERILVIEPYNNGCVYVKDNEAYKQNIKDPAIIDKLQGIIKDFTLSKEKDVEMYSLKLLYDKLERIEHLLEKIDVIQLLKK